MDFSPTFFNMKINLVGFVNCSELGGICIVIHYLLILIFFSCLIWLSYGLIEAKNEGEVQAEYLEKKLIFFFFLELSRRLLSELKFKCGACSTVASVSCWVPSFLVLSLFLTEFTSLCGRMDFSSFLSEFGWERGLFITKSVFLSCPHTWLRI